MRSPAALINIKRESLRLKERREGKTSYGTPLGTVETSPGRAVVGNLETRVSRRYSSKGDQSSCPMADYVELRGRSAFSFLEGASLPEYLAAAPLPLA